MTKIIGCYRGVHWEYRQSRYVTSRNQHIEWIGCGTDTKKELFAWIDRKQKYKFRLHITCDAGHSTYIDYNHQSSAKRAWKNNWNESQSWFGSSIEKLHNGIPITK